MSAFFTGSLPGSLVTIPLRVACARDEVCAADESEVCAESAAAARTMSHNRAAEKTFIMSSAGAWECVESAAGGDHIRFDLLILSR